MMSQRTLKIVQAPGKSLIRSIKEKGDLEALLNSIKYVEIGEDTHLSTMVSSHVEYLVI